MLAFHLGGALFLFRWIFREPRVDVRFLAAGAIFPDLIDLPLGGGLFADRYASGELWGHSLLFAAIVMTAVMVFTRRGPKRRAAMAVAIGVLFHLLLDGMWTDSPVFLWPFFGTEHPVGPMPFWQQAIDRALSDPWRWMAEAAGVLYLAWIWRWAGLADPDRRRRLWRTGVLESADPAPEPG